MRLNALIIVMLASRLCLAQTAGDFKPATSNVLDAQYPRVNSNSRVEIRFKAPDASKVRVNFWSGPKADMEKQADGFWTFMTPQMAPGLHYYTIVIDGAGVADPASTAYFGGSKWASAVEVPEAGATYYLPQHVPHGQDGCDKARRLCREPLSRRVSPPGTRLQQRSRAPGARGLVSLKGKPAHGGMLWYIRRPPMTSK
jgi:hypothetical protein